MASSKFATRRLYPVKAQFLSEEELIETERLLKNLKCSERKAASHCKAWVEHREKSIEIIGCLEKKLVNLHQACNVAHGVGSAMEVVGGLAMVAGAILTACGHKTVGEFLTKKVSPVTGVAGVATTVSSSVAETGLTIKTLNEVKMVLKNDKVYTEMLMENLEHSKKIDSYLRRIFNCSILSNTFLDVVTLCREGISLAEVGYVEISILMKELKRIASKCRDISQCTETVLQNVCTTLNKISSDPKVRQALWSICDIIHQSPSAVEFIKLGLKISIEVCDVLKVDIISSVLGFGILKTGVGVMTTKCLLGTVLIAVNVLSVISSIQDAKEETTKYSKMLKELNLALTFELNTVRKNYPMLL